MHKINNLKKLRVMSHLSQKELAARCGPGQATISEIENEKYMPNVYTAILIARILGLHVEDIFSIGEEGDHMKNCSH